MKKKILSLCLVVALVAVAVVGSTLAYFTDTDSAVNVFTMGNVDIELHEDNGDDTVADYAQDDAYRTWLKKQLLTPSVPVEKDVWVENIGKNPAFVRVCILVPYELDKLLEYDFDTTNWTQAQVSGDVDTDADNVIDYKGYSFTYNEILESNKVTSDVLTKVTLKDAVTCETLENGDILYELGTDSFTTSNSGLANIIVYAEACQTVGYDANDVAWATMNDALEATFGEAFARMGEIASTMTVTAIDAAGLAQALANAEPGATIVLDPAYDWSELTLDTPAEDVTITPADGAIVEEIDIKAPMTVTLEGFNDLAPQTGGTWSDAAIVIDAEAVVTLDNCEFTKDIAKYDTAIHTTANAKAAEVYVTGCEFNGLRAYYTADNTAPAVLEFRDCEFVDIGNWVIQHNNYPYNGNLTVDSCTFTNCTDGIMKLDTGSGVISAGYTWTFTNNTLTNIVGHDKSEAKMFAVNTIDLGATAVLANNTRDGVIWTPDASNGLKIQ